MNRRSFIKSLSSLAALPLVPFRSFTNTMIFPNGSEIYFDTVSGEIGTFTGVEFINHNAMDDAFIHIMVKAAGGGGSAYHK